MFLFGVSLLLALGMYLCVFSNVFVFLCVRAGERERKKKPKQPLTIIQQNLLFKFKFTSLLSVFQILSISIIR